MLPATPEVITAFIAEAEAAPEELTTIANVMKAPPMPFIPEEHHGDLAIFALIAYAGDTDAGERAVAPFRALAEPLADMLRPMSYPEIYMPDEEDYHPIAVGQTMFTDRLDDGAIATILDRVESSTAMMARRPDPGARRRDGPRAGRRDRVRAPAEPVHGDRRRRLRTDRRHAEASGVGRRPRRRSPLDGRGAYVNFLGDEGEAGVRAAYPGSDVGPAPIVKRRYDPGNLFRLNQNVPPRESGGRGALRGAAPRP